MIAYYLIVYLNCKTPECAKILEKERWNYNHTFILPYSGIYTHQKSYKSKYECESAYRKMNVYDEIPNSNKKLNYGHVCYMNKKMTVDDWPASNADGTGVLYMVKIIMSLPKELSLRILKNI